MQVEPLVKGFASLFCVSCSHPCIVLLLAAWPMDTSLTHFLSFPGAISIFHPIACQRRSWSISG